MNIIRKALLLLAILLPNNIFAQFYGTVVDGQTGDPVPFATAKYKNSSVGAVSDDSGKFVVPVSDNYSILEVTCVGYKNKSVVVNYGRTVQHSLIKLYPNSMVLDEVVIRPHYERYRRKGNPAVDLMRKVIAHKYLSSLTSHNYYKLDKYQKHTFSINEVSPKTFTSGFLKSFSFLKDHAEVCPETGKLILPMMMNEIQSQELYRRSTDSHKFVINGKNSQGFSTLFSSGDFFNTYINDIFTDVDIYKDNVRLLQHPFVSPISSSQAISFYHYFIMDTTVVDGEKCIDVSFIPNNTQDFGFTGHLYVLDDTSYQVKRCVLNISRHSGVNFVDNLLVFQDFERLPSGERVLNTDDMIVELKYIDAITKLQVQRFTKYSNYCFDSISDNRIFKHPEIELVRKGSEQCDSTFWNKVRPIPLSDTEHSLSDLVKNTKMLGGYKYVMLIIKALVENSVELTKSPNKVDLIPVNTMVSNNYVDGLRLRLGGQTTANLCPYLFFRGYGAYGFKDELFKYKGEVEFSFNKKKYMAHEFPRRSLMFTYMYDDMSPVDKFSAADKDNMYTSVKSTKVDYMMYVRTGQVKFQYETESYFTTTLTLSNTNTEAAGKLLFLRNNDRFDVHDITTSEVKLGFRYAPHETFINSKQKRIPANNDATIFTFEYTLGMKGVLGGDYRYNITEASIYKRFWLPYACGYLETYLKGGVQWNKVPFPLLFVPSSNLSYFVRFDNWSFFMLKNMEFLNDRYTSLFVNWDLNGKILNRIPLLKKLKWREYIGFRMLYGKLTSRNNPLACPTDNTLFVFPEEDGKRTTFMMDKTPYMEFSAGISNIFKLLTVEYVRRLNYYNDGSEDIKKNGVRFSVDITF